VTARSKIAGRGALAINPVAARAHADGDVERIFNILAAPESCVTGAPTVDGGAMTPQGRRRGQITTMTYRAPKERRTTPGRTAWVTTIVRSQVALPLKRS
jgi:hypothetical protein